MSKKRRQEPAPSASAPETTPAPAGPTAPGPEVEASAPSRWRNRIVGFDLVDADQLLAHPDNFRIHPKAQAQATEASLAQLGWVDFLRVNKNTGHVLDGHLRTSLAIKHGEKVPIAYLDLEPWEEPLFLISYDPITAMAGQDDEKLATLLAQTKDAAPAYFDDITSNVDFGDKALGLDAEKSKAELLRLMEVTIAEPRHTLQKGDVYKVGSHRLLVMDPCLEDDAIEPHRADLKSLGKVAICNYPGPMITTTTKGQEYRLLLVQPVPYIAGHILDRFEDAYGAEEIVKLAGATA